MFTTIGKDRRWIEVLPFLIPALSTNGNWDGLVREFIIYANDIRNVVGELVPEYNQAHAIVGTLHYYLDENIAQFHGENN